MCDDLLRCCLFVGVVLCYLGQAEWCSDKQYGFFLLELLCAGPACTNMDQDGLAQASMW